MLEIKLTGEVEIMPGSEIEEIKQNVRTIVLTRRGTVPMDREFGIRAEILDTPITEQSALVAEVAEAIEKFEPRARLRRIEFGGEYIEGRVEPKLIIELVERRLRK